MQPREYDVFRVLIKANGDTTYSIWVHTREGPKRILDFHKDRYTDMEVLVNDTLVSIIR